MTTEHRKRITAFLLPIVTLIAVSLAGVTITGIVVHNARQASQMTVTYEAPPFEEEQESVENASNEVVFGVGGPETSRSGHWPTVMHHFRNNQYFDDSTSTWVAFEDGIDRSCCRCCGSRDNLNVHHIKPFHIDPELECNPNNLVTLCREHHFHIGHRDNWKGANPNVCADCDRMRAKLNPNKK